MRGFFKEAVGVLITTGDIPAAACTYSGRKEAIDHRLFVQPRQIGITGTLDELTRPMKGETLQGPRVFLVTSERLTAARIEFTVELLTGLPATGKKKVNHLTLDDLRAALQSGARGGMLRPSPHRGTRRRSARVAPAPPGYSGRAALPTMRRQHLSPGEQQSMSTIEERVKKIVVEQLGVKEEEVTTNASFVDDLGADSLDTVELVMALEEEFECEIPDEEAEKITSVQQAIDYVKAHVKG